MHKQDIFAKGTKGQHLQITPFNYFTHYHFVSGAVKAQKSGCQVL